MRGEKKLKSSEKTQLDNKPDLKKKKEKFGTAFELEKIRQKIYTL